MEVIYPVGRVYKLVSTNGLAYIGSTKQSLATRLREHKCKSKSKQYSSILLFENNSNVVIELLEEHKDILKTDLQKRERFYIESITCVNEILPTRTHKEYKDTDDYKLIMSEWRASHADHVKDYSKEYYKIHQEKCIAYARNYVINNRDLIRARAKLRYEKNKGNRVVCLTCKCEFKREGKAKHEKTAKHRLNLSLLETTTASPS